MSVCRIKSVWMMVPSHAKCPDISYQKYAYYYLFWHVSVLLSENFVCLSTEKWGGCWLNYFIELMAL